MGEHESQREHEDAIIESCIFKHEDTIVGVLNALIRGADDVGNMKASRILSEAVREIESLGPNYHEPGNS